MEILQEDDGNKGRVFILRDGNTIAEMSYEWNGALCVIIDHTIVSESLKGQGVGKLLLNELAAFARKRNIKVSPVCSYAKAIMEKDKGFNDLFV